MYIHVYYIQLWAIKTLYEYFISDCVMVEWLNLYKIWNANLKHIQITKLKGRYFMSGVHGEWVTSICQVAAIFCISGRYERVWNTSRDLMAMTVSLIVSILCWVVSQDSGAALFSNNHITFSSGTYAVYIK